MRVAVVGCGYVGLVSGAGLASIGHDVVGIEVDAGRREAIAAGRAPFHEPGLEELLRSVLESGRFRVAGEISAAAEAEVVLLAVQTPPDRTGAIDLSFLREAARQVGETLSARGGERAVVAVRSTVVPGTTAGVVAPALEGGAAAASNPEFLREGSAVADFVRPDRIVVGCDDEDGRELLRRLYEPLRAPIFFTTPATAELAKYTSNAFLATLISFSNEVARISESIPGVDVEDVLEILHLDRRLSPELDGATVRPAILSYLKAGVGYGGSCLPKDLSALLATRRAAGFEHPLLDAVREVNETQPGRVVGLAERELGGLDGRTVAVLGAAFKGGTDDLRSSPGLKVVDELLARGARITLADPLVAPERLSDYAARGVRIVTGLDEALEGADAVVVTTNAPEWDELGAQLAAADGGPVVVDGRRFLRPEALSGARYVAVGRGE